MTAGNTLVNVGLLENGTRKSKPAVQTIQAYIEALTEAYSLRLCVGFPSGVTAHYNTMKLFLHISGIVDMQKRYTAERKTIAESKIIRLLIHKNNGNMADGKHRTRFRKTY